MIELISLIAKSLVKQPDAVSVTMVQKGNTEVYELHVAAGDMGKVIGKQGRIARTKNYPLILSEWEYNRWKK